MLKTEDQIIDHFRANSIQLVSFDSSLTDDILFAKSPEIVLKINETDYPKWKYFAARLNEKSKIVETGYSDGILKFIFLDDPTTYGIENYEKSLKEFLACLERKFYTVNPPRKKFSVLVKPTHNCNLDCKYCYDKPFREKIHGVMTMDILHQICRLLSEYTSSVVWIWHGGEPTVVGLEWYERAYREVFPQYPMLDFEFHMMTNGVNLDERWYEFTKKHNIQVGMSYNAYYQTQLRVSNQKATKEDREAVLAQRLENTLKYWVSKGRPLGCIDVISGANYKDQVAIYEYYKSMGAQVAMNHVFHTPQTEVNNLEIEARKYADEFLKYFKHWLYDTNGILERSAYEALMTVIGLRRHTCVNTDCRRCWLGFNPLGEMYPCDRWYPDKYKLGSVFDYQTIEEVFESDPYKQYSSEVQTRFDTTCKECGYFDVCRGGCNASAIQSTGSAAGVEKFYCELFKLKFNGVYKILRNLDFTRDFDKLNPYAKQAMLSHAFYSVKEIKAFLKKEGKSFYLEYNPDDLLNCSEYLVFRGVNPIEDLTSDITKHVDIINASGEETKKQNEINRHRDLKNYLKEVAERALKQQVKKS